MVRAEASASKHTTGQSQSNKSVRGAAYQKIEKVFQRRINLDAKQMNGWNLQLMPPHVMSPRQSVLAAGNRGLA